MYQESRIFVFEEFLALYRYGYTNTYINWSLKYSESKSYADRVLKVRQDAIGILDDSVFLVLNDHFGERTLFTRWVPHLFITGHKRDRVATSKGC